MNNIRTTNNPNNMNVIQQEQKKQKVSAPPNALNITINTSVPGFQTIKYKPNMTIPDINKDDNTVMFNPLVKLEKSVINKVPEQIRVKEFFNRGLFNSLINLHGLKREPSLAEATYYGYIDNNIQITLDTIFPTNGLIYINKNPYRIADVKWRKGDWRIATKNIDIPPLDSSKITDPFLFQSVVEDEIISGEEQMANLPDNVVFGSTYNINEDPTALGRKKTDAALEAEKIEEDVGPPIAPLALTAPEKKTEQPKTTKLALMPPEDKTGQLALPSSQIQENLPQIEYPNYPPPPVPAIEAPSKVEELDENNIPSPEVKLQVETNSTNLLQKYFKNTNYYDMINQLYLKMKEGEKRIIRQFFRYNTFVKVKENTINLSRKAYDNAVEGLQVSYNEGGGNCFFLAVADAINFNNNKYPNTKIIYDKYGNENIFTNDVLRRIVADYIYLNYDDKIQQSIVFVDDLNEIFNNQVRILEDNLQRPLTKSEYMDQVNDIYTNPPSYTNNFLVKRPDSVPTNRIDRMNPFTPLPKNEVKNYILSFAYQGDQVAIEALENALSLLVIPISKNTQGFLSLPDFELSRQGYKRYMFLFNHANHYELITFKQKSGIRSIFNILDIANIPPIYIFYLIFSTVYINLGVESQEIFYFYKPIFETFLKSFKQIYELSITSEANSQEYKKSNDFLIKFKQFFQLSAGFLKKYPHFNDLTQKKFVAHQTRKKPIISQSDRVLRSKTQKNKPKTGGQPLQRTIQPIYQPIYRSNLPPVERMLKNEEDRSNLSYHIILDIELRKGKEPLTNEEISKLGCSQKWNSVRRSFADLTGKKYVIPPVYENLQQDKKGDTKKNDNNKKGGRKTRKIFYKS